VKIKIVMLLLFKKFAVNNYLTVKIVLCNNQHRDMKKEFYSNFLIHLLKT